MRFHGLVSIVVLGLSSNAFAQGGAPAMPAPLPDNVDVPVLGLPPAPGAADPAFNIDLELKQFRNELREFQALREEIQKETREAGVDSDRLSLQQRKDLVELLTRLAKSGAMRKTQTSQTPKEKRQDLVQDQDIAIDQPTMTERIPAMPMETMSQPLTEPPIEIGDNVADPFSLGKVLFRTGDFMNAERAFRKVEVTEENAATLNYLIAICLRRQSKWQAAMDVFKVVAESDDDMVLRDLAKWQIDNIRWHRDSEQQLEQLRIEREKQFGRPKPSQAKTDKRNHSTR